MDLFAPEHETIEGVGRALRAGRTSCVEVLETCFDRIEEWEPRVRAWVLIDREGAIRQARERDEELAAGKDRGPLHGIPIGIKDIIDVQGLPTACGFRPWADRVAAEDAPIVTNLREAGAVILGKTVTTQFAWIDPPVTRNPWNLERTPGGSSSGSAAAVATGMCLGAIGSQTGGSITRPASYCGVVGLKPSFGAINVTRILPFAPSLDHPGPIARTVGDLELIFKAVIGWPGFGKWAGPGLGVWGDGGKVLDLNADPVPTDPVMRRAFAEPAQPPPHAPTLGRLRGFFDDKAEPVMRTAFEDATTTLSGAGAWVKEVPAPDGFDDVHRSHRLIMASEVAAGHERRFAQHRDDYQPRIRALIEEGLATPAVEYVRCRQHQERVRLTTYARFGLNDLEALIVPATLGPAPDCSTTGDPVFNSPWSYSGFPTVSIPFGLSPDGLPLALQIVGQLFEEDKLFRVARWCEDVLRAAYRAKKD